MDILNTVLDVNVSDEEIICIIKGEVIYIQYYSRLFIESINTYRHALKEYLYDHPCLQKEFIIETDDNRIFEGKTQLQMTGVNNYEYIYWSTGKNDMASSPDFLKYLMKLNLGYFKNIMDDNEYKHSNEDREKLMGLAIMSGKAGHLIDIISRDGEQNLNRVEIDINEEMMNTLYKNIDEHNKSSSDNKFTYFNIIALVVAGFYNNNCKYNPINTLIKIGNHKEVKYLTNKGCEPNFKYKDVNPINLSIEMEAWETLDSMLESAKTLDREFLLSTIAHNIEKGPEVVDRLMKGNEKLETHEIEKLCRLCSKETFNDKVSAIFGEYIEEKIEEEADLDGFFDTEAVFRSMYIDEPSPIDDFVVV